MTSRHLVTRARDDDNPWAGNAELQFLGTRGTGRVHARAHAPKAWSLHTFVGKAVSSHAGLASPKVV